jgi:trimethylamine monooxygenase
MYVGMQDQWYSFTMFDAEVWFARDVILGRLALPAYRDMSADMADWTAREAAADDPYKMIDFQTAYVAELVRQTDYPSFDLALTQNEFKAWKKAKEASITTYRNKSHRSAVTGTTAPAHHTAWWDAMDDTLDTFLNN